MENLSLIKTRISTIESVIKAMDAMKMVSTVKLARINPPREAKDCAQVLFDMLSMVIGNMSFDQVLDKSHWVFPQNNGKALILIFSADQGFCAGFNQDISEFARKVISKYNDPIIKVFGKKAASISQSELIPITNRIDFHAFARVVNGIMKDHLITRKVSEVVVVSSRFVNVMSQKAFSQQIFPFEVKETPGYVKLENVPSIDALFEMYMGTLLHGIIVEHITSELSARVMAMDNSVRNAKDVVKSLNVLYNSVRQAKITRELTEIVASMESVQ
jgi:F-type H+-transporting ATPase subunit gamma